MISTEMNITKLIEEVTLPPPSEIQTYLNATKQFWKTNIIEVSQNPSNGNITKVTIKKYIPSAASEAPASACTSVDCNNYPTVLVEERETTSDRELLTIYNNITSIIEDEVDSVVDTPKLTQTELTFCLLHKWIEALSTTSTLHTILLETWCAKNNPNPEIRNRNILFNFLQGISKLKEGKSLTISDAERYTQDDKECLQEIYWSLLYNLKIAEKINKGELWSIRKIKLTGFLKKHLHLGIAGLLTATTFFYTKYAPVFLQYALKDRIAPDPELEETMMGIILGAYSLTGPIWITILSCISHNFFDDDVCRKKFFDQYALP